MRQFYTVTEKLHDLLIADDNVNTVTIGDITEVDLMKQSIFPLSHIIVNPATLNGSTIELSFTVICMDIVDFSKKIANEETDVFYGNNDLHDIWNTQLAVCNRLVENLRRGDAFDELFQLTDSVNATPFKDRFENLLAGWAIDITIRVPNNEICISSSIGIAPTNLTATRLGSSSIKLDWVDNSSVETVQIILRSTSPLGGFIEIGTVGTDVTTYTDSTIAIDTFYFYKIKVDGAFSNLAFGYIPTSDCDPATATLGDGGDTIATIESGGIGAITIERDGVDITGDSNTNGSGLITVPVCPAPLNTANPIKTGQTTSYTTGDDGDLQEGRLTDFITLDWNNPFGNTNRFTDELGGQTYTNGIFIDWSTYNQVSQTVIGYDSGYFGTSTFDTACSDARSAVIGGFSDWRMLNRQELMRIYSMGNGFGWDSSFANLTIALPVTNYWCSNTRITSSTSAYYLIGSNGEIRSTGKTSALYYRVCRTFTWNGTSLT